MHIRLNLFVDTDKSQLTIENEIINILKNTSDYQHGDVTVDSGSILRTRQGDFVETSFYLEDCSDIARTKNVFDELIQYFRKQFV